MVKTPYEYYSIRVSLDGNLGKAFDRNPVADGQRPRGAAADRERRSGDAPATERGVEILEAHHVGCGE